MKIMNNMNLLDFKFVDREIERKIIYNFLTESKTDKILWIHGESGVGKTELVKYFMNYFQHYKFIHVNPVKMQEISYFSSFVQELDEEKTTLRGFILKNYSQIYDLSKDTISDINPKAKFLAGIAELAGRLFVDACNNYFSITNVITRYIINISKEKHYVFIFDNFQQCDIMSLEIIQGIIQNLIETTNVKFIFATTDGELAIDSDVIKFLVDKMPSTPILIEPFKAKEYFLDILLDIFSLEDIKSADVEQLFLICSGVPEKLKNFIRNMYLANGIQYYNNYAKFIPQIFKDTLSRESADIDFNSLNLIQKLILQITACWNEKIPIDLLIRVSKYVANKALALPTELEKDISRGIYGLVDLRILELNEQNIKIKHDLLYLSPSSQCNVLSEGVLYAKLNEYITINSKEIIELYSQTFFELNNALYSYKADANSWPQINLACLKNLITQSDFQNINKIIGRLERCLSNLATPDLLLVAECFYNEGEYVKARSVLNYVNSKEKDDTECFKYYYLSGKLYNMSMDKEDAEKELLLAQNYVASKSEEEILIKHMLQLVLVEVVEKRHMAKEIFCSISEHLDEYDDNSKALGILLKNCSNYYSGNAALKLLKKANDISQNNNDIVEQAFIKNNMGYEYFKLHDYDKCEHLYQESIAILSQTKIHESAYPLGNLAVCYMIKHKYEEALKLIKRASFWNCSNYLKLVLDTHLMLCYEQTGEREDSFKIAERLYNIVDGGEIKDYVILRKIYLNLAINYDKLQLEKYAQICSQKAYPYCVGTSSEYRAAKIYNKYNNKIKEYPSLDEEYCKKSYFDHWLTIFSHD